MAASAARSASSAAATAASAVSREDTGAALFFFANAQSEADEGDACGDVNLAFWASDIARHLAPSSLAISPKVNMGFAATILGRSALQNFMYGPGSRLGLSTCSDDRARPGAALFFGEDPPFSGALLVAYADSTPGSPQVTSSSDPHPRRVRKR